MTPTLDLGQAPPIGGPDQFPAPVDQNISARRDVPEALVGPMGTGASAPDLDVLADKYGAVDAKPAVDLEALAAKHGAVDAAQKPKPFDLDALAAKHGANDYHPPFPGSPPPGKPGPWDTGYQFPTPDVSAAAKQIAANPPGVPGAPLASELKPKNTVIPEPTMDEFRSDPIGAALQTQISSTPEAQQARRELLTRWGIPEIQRPALGQPAAGYKYPTWDDFKYNPVGSAMLAAAANPEVRDALADTALGYVSAEGLATVLAADGAGRLLVKAATLPAVTHWISTLPGAEKVAAGIGLAARTAIPATFATQAAEQAYQDVKQGKPIEAAINIGMGMAMAGGVGLELKDAAEVASFKSRIRSILQDRLNRDFAASQAAEQTAREQPTGPEALGKIPGNVAPPPPPENIQEGEFEPVGPQNPPPGAPEAQPVANSAEFIKAHGTWSTATLKAATKFMEENPGTSLDDAKAAVAGTVGLEPQIGDFKAPPAPPPAQEPTPAPEPVKPTKVDRVSPATPNPPTAAVPTQPESPETIALQMQQLSGGQRRVVMFPQGQGIPSLASFPPGIAVHSDGLGNVYAYRPDLIKKSEISSAAKNNKLPEILGGPGGMGAPDKADLQGPPLAVVGRAADGTEAQTTVTDQASLPHTVIATHAVTPEGGTIEIKRPEEALDERTEPQIDEGLYKQAVDLVRASGNASPALLQRNLRLGYGAASRVLDRMHAEGIIGPPNGSAARQLLTSQPKQEGVIQNLPPQVPPAAAIAAAPPVPQQARLPEQNAPAVPPLPQVPNAPETKYVLPTFATGRPVNPLSARERAAAVKELGIDTSQFDTKKPSGRQSLDRLIAQEREKITNPYEGHNGNTANQNVVPGAPAGEVAAPAPNVPAGVGSPARVPELPPGGSIVTAGEIKPVAGSERDSGVRKVTGSADIPLSPAGEKQVDGMADKKEVAPFTAVIHPDSERATETAKAFAGGKLKLNSLHGWGRGIYEGQPADAVQAEMSHLIMNPDEVPPGVSPISAKPGQSWNQMAFPMFADVDRLKKAIRPDERFLVVTSGGNLQAIDAWGKAGYPANFEFDHSAIAAAPYWSVTGKMFELGPRGLLEVKNNAKPGQIYLTEHGETAFNNKGGTGSAQSATKNTERSSTWENSAPPSWWRTAFGTENIKDPWEVVRDGYIKRIKTDPAFGQTMMDYAGDWADGKAEAGQDRRLSAKPTIEGEDNNVATAEPSEHPPILADVPPADVRGVGEERPTESSPAERGESDARRAGESDRGGAASGSGVGGIEPRLGVPTSGERPASPGARSGPTTADYRITEADQIGSGGVRQKASDNIEAIRTLKKIESENREATPEEQKILAKYVGWGGMPQAFSEYGGPREWQPVRADLDSLLTPEEFASARASTPNAHFTSPLVIKGMWDAMNRLGIIHPGEEASILEPSMGVGTFFGLQPPDEAAKSQRVGVELDSVTGRIASLLYPNADVQVKGFEKTRLPNNYFDLAIGNVPFGNYGVHDPAYKKTPVVTRSIHDYFFAKAIDKVRPGGVVAFITSSYTMDKGDSKIRQYLADRADLVGAIRLPNTTFKGNAGTEVTTDIIFLRKRAPQTPAAGESWISTEPFMGTKTRSDGTVGSAQIPINEYYARHSDMMLGQMSLEGSMYAANTPTLTGTLTPEALAAAINKLPENVAGPLKAEDRPAFDTMASVADAGDIKEGGYGIRDGIVVMRSGDRLEPVNMSPDQADRIKGTINIRDAVRGVFQSQINDLSESQISQARKSLNDEYDNFVKKFGALHQQKNARAFVDDPDAPLLLSLEDWDADTKTAKKAPIFTQRTIDRYRPVQTADNAKDALSVVLNEKGRIDWMRMEDLTGKTPAEIQDELGPLIYQNPSGRRWETADEYLSGNVRQKLAEAQSAGPEFDRNIEALRAVQPVDLEPHEIDGRLGSSWIPKEDVRRFVAELLNIPESNVGIGHAASLGAWTVDIGGYKKLTANTQTWGTARYYGHELIEDALNMRSPTVYDRVRRPDGSEASVINEKETINARETQQRLKEEFAKWIWSDQPRADRLARGYNDEFNSVRLREFDGSHLSFPGMAAGLTLRPHQKNSVWRMAQSGNTLLAHVVGAGKTYEIIAGAMEQRRLGLARKPMAVVPKNRVDSTAEDWLRAYPAANILAMSSEDFTPKNRQKIMGRIATGNWDGVIVSYESFEKLPVKDETFNAFLQKQIDELEDYIHASKRERGSAKIVKELEKAKKRLEAKLRNKAEGIARDRALSFEDLGVDSLFVDEADNFKNLYFPTKMTRIAGIPNTESKRAFDMYIKTQHVVDRNGGSRGLVFATGTPIANTMAEMYTMQRYLQPAWLKEHGLEHFDAWANTFGEVRPTLETTPDATGVRVVNRFARFVNIPELVSGFRNVADVQTAEMLKLPVPEIVGGKPNIISAEASPLQREYLKTLAARAKDIKDRKVKPNEDNMLKVSTDGRKAGLDLRLIDPHSTDYPGSKINKAADKIYQIWKDQSAKKSTQLVFLDFSRPSLPGEKRFSASDDLKEKLINRGIPSAEIAFIHDAPSDAQKEKLFADFNAGRKRVMIGSTQKMGVGLNVQKLLYAAHHLDAPWRPRDIEQRDGRIVRQGNTNKKVELHIYVTEPSFDAKMWDTLKTKATFIAQVMKGDVTVRSAEDISETALNYAEVSAIASGNPAIREKALVDAEVRKLDAMRARHDQVQATARRESALLPGEISGTKRMISGAETDINVRDHNKPAFMVGPHVFEGEGSQKKFDEAIQALLDQHRGDLRLIRSGNPDFMPLPVGSYRGLSIEAFFPYPRDARSGDTLGIPHVQVRGSLTYNDVKPSASSIKYAVDNVPEYRKSAFEGELKNQERRLVDMKALIGQPFQDADKFRKAQQRQAELDKELQTDAADPQAEGIEDGDEIDSPSPASSDDGSGVYMGSGLGALQPGLEDLYKHGLKPAAKSLAEFVKQAADEIQRDLMPQTRGPDARYGYNLLREMNSEIDQRRDVAHTALGGFRQWFKNNTQKTLGFYGLDAYDDAETGNTANLAGPARDFADAAHALFEAREQDLRDLKLLNTFVENYLPHIYAKPNEAQKANAAFMAKRPMAGPESFRKQRTYMTLKEGLESGLKPKYDNPADMVLAKLAEMDKSIMAHRAFEELDEADKLHWVPNGGTGTRPPDGMDWIKDKLFQANGPRFGVVGLPDEAENVTPQDVRVFGRRIMGAWAAPAILADVINNHLEPGTTGNLYKAYRGINNTLNLLELGLSYFHGMTTTLNASYSDIALGLQQAIEGQYKDGKKASVGKGLVAAATSIGRGITPFASVLTDVFGPGKKLIYAWDHWKPEMGQGKVAVETKNGPSYVDDPISWAILDAMKAGGGSPRQDSYYATKYVERMMDGVSEMLHGTMAESAPGRVKAALVGGAAGAFMGGIPGAAIGAGIGAVAGKAGLNAPGALLEYSMRPIMDYMVPRAKVAGFAKLMMEEINRNPEMTRQELRDVAGRIWDSMDDRFGQLRQKNMMMNASAKKIINAAVGRFGWQAGSLRTLGMGATYDLAKTAGEVVNNLRQVGEGKTPRLSKRTYYILGLLLGHFILSAIMTYLLTGKKPEGLDYVDPETGGFTETGHAARIIMPDYVSKDIQSYATNPRRTLIAKLAPELTIAMQLAMNRDFYDHKIYKDGRPGEAEGLREYAKTFLYPYSAQGVLKNIERNASPDKTLLPMIGLNPAGNGVGLSKAERMIADYMDEQGRNTRSLPTMHTRAQSQVYQAARRGDEQKAADLGQKAIMAGNMTPQQVRSAEQRARTGPLMSDYKNVTDFQTAMRIYAAATDDERKALAPEARAKVYRAQRVPYEWNNSDGSPNKELRAIVQRYFPNFRPYTPPGARAQPSTISPAAIQ